MSEESKSNQGSDVAKSLLKDYFQGVRNLESAYTFSFVSLVLSVLFVSKVFDFFMLNLLYVLNISFFALVVRDSWLMRKKYHPSGFNHCKHRIDLNAANRSFENCKYLFVTDIRSVLMQETL